MHEIVFVSKDAQLQFNHCFPTINVQQRVIYNLIDTELIRKEAEREKPKKRKFTIVAVGRLVEAKRFDRLINVCGMLKQNHYDVDTWIIGEGHLRNELEEQIKELHLQDTYNVFFPYLDYHTHIQNMKLEDISVVHFVFADKPWYIKGEKRVEKYLERVNNHLKEMGEREKDPIVKDCIIVGNRDRTAILEEYFEILDSANNL